MVAELPDVPPAVILLLTAVAQSKDWIDLRKKIRSMLKDLREQSIAYESSSSIQEPLKADPLRFDIHLHGGLDLFREDGGCADLACRVQAADRVVRSMGLIADRIWLTDLISEKFVDFGRATNEKLDLIIADAIVLGRIAPLILEGIIKFRSPWRPVCTDCLSHFDDGVEAIAKELAVKFVRQAKLVPETDGSFSLRTGNFFEPSLVFRGSSNADEGRPKVRDEIEAIIYRQVRSAMWATKDAALFGGSLFSNSRVGLAGILRQEGRLNDSRRLMLLDRERAIEIPWVSELTAGQILELRQEASNALPSFREKMARTLSVDDDLNADAGKPREFIQELREQAIEVRSELSVTQKSSARFWKTTYGLLGLGLSAYGVANDQVLPGVGGLLPLINLLINHKSGHGKDLDKLTRRPGYVLVKAQDLLAHSR